MEQRTFWLQQIAELQSLAQAGLAYSKDPYDLERFTRIRELSAEMLSHLSDLPSEKVREIFCSETGYQTPKLDTRAAIVEDGRILLVRERDGRWSLPGGWCDVNLSVGENTAKEVREEAGLEVRPLRIIAVQDRARHNRPVYATSICKIFVLCSVLGGSFAENTETTDSGYFAADQLPELATEKTNEEQVRMCLEAARTENWVTRFD